jgi:hypothetical protein
MDMIGRLSMKISAKNSTDCFKFATLKAKNEKYLSIYLWFERLQDFLV